MAGNAEQEPLPAAELYITLAAFQGFELKYCNVPWQSRQKQMAPYLESPIKLCK